MEPEERAREGVFMAFQYPVEIPGVSNTYFLKAALNAVRKHRGLAELDAIEFLELVRAEDEAGADGRERCSTARSTRGSRAARRSATRSSTWRCSSRAWRSSTRPTPGSTSTPCASSPTASTPCVSRTAPFLVITHYQRLLNYIVPDFVHVLVDGRIVRSGGKELALELEAKGYAWLEDEARAAAENAAAGVGA